MAASLEDIKRWVNNREPKHTHMLVVCDEFDHEDYPVYVEKGEDAQLIYKRVIEDLEVGIKRMERDQENMLDLSPENATSLKLASDFNAQEYADKDLDLAMKIRNSKIKLKIAKKRYGYLFEGTAGAHDASEVGE